MSGAMNDWNPDNLGERDVMLTAYALGELDEPAIAAMDALLEDDPTLRGELDAIRAIAADLEAAFAVEFTEADWLDEQRRAVVHAGVSAVPAIAASKADDGPVTTWNRWATRIGGGVALAATIGFVAIVSLPGPDQADDEVAMSDRALAPLAPLDRPAERAGAGDEVSAIEPPVDVAIAPPDSPGILAEAASSSPEIQSLLSEARGHLEGARYAQAAQSYGEVIAMQPAHAEATEGLRVSQSLLNSGPIPLVLADGSSIDRDELRERVKVEFEESLGRAEESLLRGSYSMAESLALEAKVLVQVNAELFEQPEVSERFSRADEWRVKIQAEREEVELAGIRSTVMEASAVHAESPQPDAPLREAQRVRIAVNERLMRVRQLQLDQKYDEALAVVEEIQFLDEENPSAAVLREVLASLSRSGASAAPGSKEPSYLRNSVRVEDRMVFSWLRPSSGRRGLSEIIEVPEGWWERGVDAEDAGAYGSLRDNSWALAADEPLSTFSIDVDTASYANVRRFLGTGSRPPKDAVRIEEMINSFDYDYPVPAADAEHPFSVTVESGPAPWAEQHRLVRVGLKGFEMSMDERPAANLVFLLDCSGSMNQPNKLPLVKAGLKMLVRELGPSDRVALVVYAGNASMVLDSTVVTDTGRATIEMAIDQLGAGGSTNGEGGIQLAYRVAAANMVSGGVNRVILCTDGDFNVGVSGPDALQSLVEQQRETGVFLSVCGFGTGNLKDDAMERLSNHGNGTAAYIDSMREAEKVFVRNAVSSLVTIAKDVKIQVDFNPGQVQAYRLIGYANRMLKAEDFNNDRVDAGEIGAGHTVTALYEIIPVGVEIPGGIDESKYTQPEAADEAEAEAEAEEAAAPIADSPELLTVRVRYKQPEGDSSVRFDTPHTDAGNPLDETTTDFRFAASVAGFGMLLRDSAYAGSLSWDMVTALGEPGLADDPHGDRREFLALVRAATVSGP